MKNLIVFGLVIAVAAGAGYYFFFSPGYSKSPEKISLSFPTDTIVASDHVKGARNAKTLLVEYSDFQCPACGAYYPLVKQIGQDFGGAIAIVYRHFPLRQHEHAEIAAHAAEAAGAQGKFWEMHNMLFEHQKDWSSQNNAKDIFIQYAESLGLDRARFATDIDSKEIANKVKEEYQSGIDADVTSTPTFFLNGKKLDTPRTYDEFKTLIGEAITHTQ